MMTTGIRMAQWAQIIQDRKASGDNIKEYCQNRGLSKDAYYYWQKKLKEIAYEQMAMINAEPEQAGLIGTGFTEIKIRESQPLSSYVEHIADGQLSIEASGLKITADAAYPADRLAYLLRELVRPC
jgi:hypothetical protein